MFVVFFENHREMRRDGKRAAGRSTSNQMKYTPRWQLSASSFPVGERAALHCCWELELHLMVCCWVGICNEEESGEVSVTGGISDLNLREHIHILK